MNFDNHDHQNKHNHQNDHNHQNNHHHQNNNYHQLNPQIFHLSSSNHYDPPSTTDSTTNPRGVDNRLSWQSSKVNLEKNKTDLSAHDYGCSTAQY